MKAFSDPAHPSHATHRALRGVALSVGALSFAGLLGGCVGAPSIPVAGAYFPAWLACGLIGVAASIVARIALVATGLGGVLPLQQLVCLSIGAVCAGVAWAALVGL